MEMNYVSQSPENTAELARSQAQELIQKYSGQPLVIALEGDLGAGKTTFTQAFASALGVKDKVKSPTFVLMKHYELQNVPQYTNLYHLDCYRLNDAADLGPLGMDEIFQKNGNIVLVEWAERIKEVLPQNHLLIQIEHKAEQVRNIIIK